MHLTLLSDLHREFRSDSKELWEQMGLSKLPKTDICILAGDIGHPLLKRNKVSEDGSAETKRFSACPKWLHVLTKLKSLYKYVLYVPGNHEYYQAQELKATPAEVDLVMREACKQNDVIFLNCDVWKHPEAPEVEFFGCTLWSEMKGASWSQMNDSRAFAKHSDFLEAHYAHRKWLKSALAMSAASSKYVITHYLPSFQLIHPRFRTSAINDAFASNCEDLVEQKNIQGWFYGHSHEFARQLKWGIPFYSNPLGYPSESRWTQFSHDVIPLILTDVERKSWQDSAPGSCPPGTDLTPTTIFSLQTSTRREKQQLVQSYHEFYRRYKERSKIQEENSV